MFRVPSYLVSVSPPVNQIGNPVLPYPGVLGPYVQIFLNHVIPADTNIVSVSYLLKASGKCCQIACFAVIYCII